MYLTKYKFKQERKDDVKELPLYFCFVKLKNKCSLLCPRS